MAGNIVKIQIKATADTAAIKQVQAQLAALKDKTVKVKVDVDKSSLKALDAIGKNKKIKVEVDKDSLKGLGKNGNQRIKVDLDSAGYSGKIAALTRPRTQTVKVNVDSSTYKNIMRAGHATQFLGNAAKKASLPLLALSGASILAGAGTAAGPYALAGVLGAAAIAGGALATVMTGGIAGGLIAVAAQSDKVKEHFKFMSDDVSSRMKEMVKPLEGPLVNTATALGAAFHDSIAPAIERITPKVAGLVDQFNEVLPAIGREAGPALEKMFDAGLPGMQKLISKLPDLTKSVGNFFESLGSENVQKAFGGAVDALPKLIEGTGKAIEGAANSYYKLKDFMNSDAMKPMREGLSKFADNVKDLDYSRLIQGASDLANSFGNLAGNADIQSFVDNIGKVAGGLSNVVDVIDRIGLSNAMFAGIGARMAGSILGAFGAEFAKKLAAKLAAGFLADKVLDGVDALTDIVTDGLSSALSNGLGNFFGSFLGNLAGNWLADLFRNDDYDVNVNVKEVNWPDNSDTLEVAASISSLAVAADAPTIDIQANVTGLDALNLPTGEAITIPVAYEDPGLPALQGATALVVVSYEDPGFTPPSIDAVRVPVVWGDIGPFVPPAIEPVKVPVILDTSSLNGGGSTMGGGGGSFDVPVTPVVDSGFSISNLIPDSLQAPVTLMAQGLEKLVPDPIMAGVMLSPIGDPINEMLESAGVQTIKVNVEPLDFSMENILGGFSDPISLNVTPKFDESAISGESLAPIEVPVQPDTSGLSSFQAPEIAPIKVKVEYEVPTAPVLPEITSPKVNIEYNVTAPVMPEIPAVEVTVTSNSSSVAAELNAIPTTLSSTHTVTTNAASVRGEIMSLNGMNTSSTHTINVVKTGDTGPGTGR